jgi:hypothetical protein
MERVSLGRYFFHDLECRIVRRRELLYCYVRVPFGHELYGRTRLPELNLALGLPFTIGYSGGGEHGWFFGVHALLSWEAALDACERLARELTAFELCELWSPPRPKRNSGIRPRFVTDEPHLEVVDVDVA